MAERQNCEVLLLENAKRSEDEQREDEEEEEEEEEDDDDDGDLELQDEHREVSEVLRVEPEPRESQSQTLGDPFSLPCLASDLQSDFNSSSHLLSEVPVNYTTESLESAEFKERVGDHEISPIDSVPTVLDQMPNLRQMSSCPTSSPEFSPTSVTQSISSAQSPTVREQRLSSVVKVKSPCAPEVEQKNSLELKTTSATPIVKTPSGDGYNWRKYGQKQVKSPKGSRSYYKCTYSDCYAKKIECCDHSGHMIEMIYKDQHNHEPPRKISCTRESRTVSSAGPVVENSIIVHSVGTLKDSDPFTSSKEPTQEPPPVHERKRQNSNGSEGNVEIKVEEEHMSEPDAKRRVKKSSLAYSSSLFKPGKKPKFVVHAAGDVGISGDGYRWRKYGQKMVKGNPHPRNYYRCTSAGCPVRKHIERAVDNTNAVIITYKGIHDHDMPVPKKRHGPPSAPLVAAAAPASMNNLQFKKADVLQNDVTSTQWSVDKEGELTGEALDLGGEKAMESARTLLSIGFEIKPC